MEAKEKKSISKYLNNMKKTKKIVCEYCNEEASIKCNECKTYLCEECKVDHTAEHTDELYSDIKEEK